MNPGSSRERSHSEVMFGTLRVLMASYQLWGGDGGLALHDLAALLGVRADRLSATVAYLLGEGLVVVRPESQTVRLSEEGVRQLVRTAAPPPPDAPLLM